MNYFCFIKGRLKKIRNNEKILFVESLIYNRSSAIDHVCYTKSCHECHELKTFKFYHSLTENDICFLKSNRDKLIDFIFEDNIIYDYKLTDKL